MDTCAWQQGPFASLRLARQMYQAGGPTDLTCTSSWCARLDLDGFPPITCGWSTTMGVQFQVRPQSRIQGVRAQLRPSRRPKHKNLTSSHCIQLTIALAGASGVAWRFLYSAKLVQCMAPGGSKLLVGTVAYFKLIALTWSQAITSSW